MIGAHQTSNLERIMKKDEFEKKVLQGVYDAELASELIQLGVADDVYLQRAKSLELSLIEIKQLLTDRFGELPDIITTVGVYPNGPSKINAVSKEDILFHVHYNMTNRGGRGLIVHNQIFYNGLVDDKKLQDELKVHGAKTFYRSSAPYH